MPASLEVIVGTSEKVECTGRSAVRGVMTAGCVEQLCGGTERVDAGSSLPAVEQLRGMAECVSELQKRARNCTAPRPVAELLVPPLASVPSGLRGLEFAALCTAPRLVPESSAMALAPAFVLGREVRTLFVCSPDFGASLRPSSVRGCAFVASLRERQWPRGVQGYRLGVIAAGSPICAPQAASAGVRVSRARSP